MGDSERLREILAQIAELAGSAAGEGENDDGYGDGQDEYGGGEDYGEASRDDGVPPPRKADAACSPRVLPTRLLVKAAEVATSINPVNAPFFGPAASLGADHSDLMEPARIAVLTSKYWGPSPRRLTVSFMESTPPALRARIVHHLNAWSKATSISFVETSGAGDVRISRGAGGYWSYLGTDIRLIPRNRPTMNLQGFTMSTPDEEYKRVVRHEAGHTLGFPHEHMRAELVARIDREKAYEYFRRTQGWSRAEVDQQVLTPLSSTSIFGTPPDETSIMCYQLPGSITRNGKPILGGKDINATDLTFAGRIYPRSFLQTGLAGARSAREGVAAAATLESGHDWDESEDPEVEELAGAR
jgi:hypothetical protein